MSTTPFTHVASISREQRTISAGKGDVLRPAQVASYATLTPPAWLTLPLCERVVTLGAVAALTSAQRDELNALMADLPKSHIWAKGFAAAQLLADHALDA
jgi:hypothetical protein